MDFLIVQGGIKKRFPGYERKALALFGTVVSTKASDLPNLEQSVKNLPFFPASQYHQPIICGLLHPASPSCSRYHLEFFLECLPRGLRLYLPLNLITGLIFRFKSLLKDPGAFFLQWLKASSRSTLFLSSFCTVCYVVVCHARHLFGREIPFMYHLNGFLAGLTIMIESKPKRIEFAMYCLPRAVESLWRLLVQKGAVRNIR